MPMDPGVGFLQALGVALFKIKPQLMDGTQGQVLGVFLATWGPNTLWKVLKLAGKLDLPHQIES